VAKRRFWTKKKIAAAEELSLGALYREAADVADVSERTIKRWMNIPEFVEEVDRLSCMNGIASKAERLRIAKRAVRQFVTEAGAIKTGADLLSWLKFVQGEVEQDGFTLGLASLIDEAVAMARSGQAGSGATGPDEKGGGETET